MDAYVYLRKKHKLLRDQVVTYAENLDAASAISMCLEPLLVPWDIPRPLVLQRHCRDFETFGRVIFKKDDFVENFPYDALEIECAARPDGIPEYFDEFI